MAEPIGEDKVNQIHEELLKAREEKEKQGMISKIPYESRKYLAIAIIIAVYYMYKTDLELSKGLLWVGGAMLILYLFLQDETKSRRLTEQECVISLQKKLAWKQKYRLGKHYQLPQGEIVIELVGKERWIEGKPWKREMGFYIIPGQTKFKKYYSAEIDVWSGDIIGLRERPKKYTGSESPDMKYIASKEVLDEKRYHDYGGKFYKK